MGRKNQSKHLTKTRIIVVLFLISTIILFCQKASNSPGENAETVSVFSNTFNSNDESTQNNTQIIIGDVVNNRKDEKADIWEPLQTIINLLNTIF